MILTEQDIHQLESMSDDTGGYFARMSLYLERLVRDGIREGRFTLEEAREDRDLALWRAFAWNNMGGCQNYYNTIQWMVHSQKNAGGCGCWHYRYAVALLYSGEPEKAREYLQRGTVEEPDYPWNWLQLGKLRAHFGDREGALAAADRGLALVPGDYEFTTLRREILEGRTLREMEYHYICQEADQSLQEDQDPETLQKRWDVAGILPDPAGLERNKALLQAESWGTDGPWCSCRITAWGRCFTLNLRMSPALFSRIDPQWLSGLRRWLDHSDGFLSHSTHQTYWLEKMEVGLDGRLWGHFRGEETGTRYINCASGQPVPEVPALL